MPQPIQTSLPAPARASLAFAGHRPDSPVVVEIDGAPCTFRLRVTEDAQDYGVLADFGDTPADAFDVELDDNRVLILVRRRPLLPGGRAPQAPRGSVVALAFGQALDAAGCSGECSDGLLRLSLRKRPAGTAAGVPLAVAALC